MRAAKKRIPARKTPLTVLTDGLLLFLALVSVAFCVLTVYGLEADHQALLKGCGALTLVWLVIFSLPRFKLPLTVLVLGLWGWALRQLWEPILLGEASIWCGVVNTAAKKIPGISAIEPVAQLPAEVWPVYTTLWLLMAGVVYTLALAFCLLCLRQTLPTFLLTLLPILPALCVTEAPDDLPMASLVAVWLTLLLTSGTAAKDPAGTARLRLPALGLAWVSLLALLVLSLVPVVEGPCQPAWAAQARADAFNAVNRMDFSAVLSRFDFLGWRGSGSTQYVSLTGGGASRTGRSALRVHTNVLGKHYLRGYSADVYTGTRWEPMSRADRRELEDILAAEETTPQLMLGQATRDIYSYIPFYSSTYRPMETREPDYQTMTVENIAAPGGCVYYPYALTELPEGASFGDDSHLHREGQTWEHTYQFLPDWEDLPYMYWPGLGAQEDSSAGASRAYRGFVYDHYLQLPEDTRQMLLDWIDQMDGERYLLGVRSPEDYAKLLKWAENQWANGEGIYLYGGDPLQNGSWAGEEVTDEEIDRLRTQYAYTVWSQLAWWLEETTTYDMDTPAPPAGEDYVNWFLNESHQGYCMHYATAGTLLLRAMGIPARYVSGYVVDVPRSGYAVVPDSAAHAWVEIYFDDIGWYPVECTPGFQGEGTGTLTTAEFAQEEPPAATPSPTPSAATTPSAAPPAAPSAAPSAPPRENAANAAPETPHTLPPWPLLLLSLAALALVGWRWRLRRRREKLTQADTNAAVLWAWRCHRRLQSWERAGKVPEEKEALDQSLAALAQKARFSQHTLSEAERQRALQLLQREAELVEAALPPWKSALFRLWRRMG